MLFPGIGTRRKGRTMKVAHGVPKWLLFVGAMVLLFAVSTVYAQVPSRPSAPILTPNHEQRSVEVRWNPALPPETTATWEVWVWTESSGWTQLDDGNLTVTRFVHTGLETGVEYWYTYRANYAGGDDEQYSLFSNIMLSDAPTSFVAPTVTAQLIGQDINVRWTEVPGITHYRLACWCGSGRWEVVDAWDMFETNYRVFPSITYHFAVQAVNSAGDSTAWSELATVTTPAVIPTPTPEPHPTPTPTPTPVSASAYNTWLPGITIAPENQCTNLFYERPSYGFDRRSPAAQALRERIVASMGGRIYDPYLGLYLGGFNEVVINHVVDIREAHISGMCHENRRASRPVFVYDVENAVLTSHHLTGHSDAYDLAEWLPELNRCWYVNQVVHVKRKFGLTMDADEANTAIDVLSGCSSTDMIFSNSPTPTPTIVTNDPLQMYDDDGDGQISCDEARRHGIAPVHSVHPAYPYMSDPDGNGIACE